MDQKKEKKKLPYGIQLLFTGDLTSIKDTDVLVNKVNNYEAVRQQFKKGYEFKLKQYWKCD